MKLYIHVAVLLAFVASFSSFATLQAQEATVQSSDKQNKAFSFSFGLIVTTGYSFFGQARLRLADGGLGIVNGLRGSTAVSLEPTLSLTDRLGLGLTFSTTLLRSGKLKVLKESFEKHTIEASVGTMTLYGDYHFTIAGVRGVLGFGVGGLLLQQRQIQFAQPEVTGASEAQLRADHSSLFPDPERRNFGVFVSPRIQLYLRNITLQALYQYSYNELFYSTATVNVGYTLWGRK